jgi:hypothetical protein
MVAVSPTNVALLINGLRKRPVKPAGKAGRTRAAAAVIKATRLHKIKKTGGTGLFTNSEKAGAFLLQQELTVKLASYTMAF